MHRCRVEEQVIVGQRPNPLNSEWNEWTLVACTKCKKLTEWQHHSAEQMHGGDISVDADVTADYLAHAYGLVPEDLSMILRREKLVRCYDKRTGAYLERYV